MTEPRPLSSIWRGLLGILLFATSTAVLSNHADAHAPGENYVWINIDHDRISGRFEIHLNDLKNKLGIDWSEFGETPAEGVAASADQVREFLLSHFEIRFGDEEIGLEFGDTSILNEDGEYAQYHYQTSEKSVPDRFMIRNDIFITDDDPLHRSLVVLEHNRKLDEAYGESAIMVFGPHRSEQELDLNDVPSLLQPFDFVWQGVLHIWIGIDHILFLLALLLLAVMVKEDGQWKPVPTFRRAFWNVFKIVTIFTVAHSITLSLAALKLVDVESRIVESLIALSIIIVAINNIFPKFNDKTWLVIFFFGLFHGMGFASVMGELPFRTISLLQVLLAFNVGVELGQLAIVAAVFPLIYLLSRHSLYRPVVVVGGSIAICVIASMWFVERAFAL